MPTTPTGRGAQVIVDPGSLTAMAIRGSYAATMEANLAKVRSDRLVGTFASGDTTADGTTLTGGRATDGAVVPGGTGLPQLLNPPVAAVSNPASTTENTLQTFSIPGGTLARIGDRVRIVAGGTMTGNTDARFARMRLNATTIYATINSSSATTAAWRLEADVVKTGTNTQARNGIGYGTAATTTVNAGTDVMVDTAPIVVTVTGQDTTSAAGGTVTSNYLSVDYIPSTS